MSSLSKHRRDACETVDSAVFSGDMLHDSTQRTEFAAYLARWNRAMSTDATPPSDLKAELDRAYLLISDLRIQLGELALPCTAIEAAERRGYERGVIDASLPKAAGQPTARPKPGEDDDSESVLRELSATLVDRSPERHKAIERTLSSLAFYRKRCELLQRTQVRMRDPERTLVCDILANGQLLGPVDGLRYRPAPVAAPGIYASVVAEVERATQKFPTWPTDPLHALAVLGEEFGELTKAVLQTTYEPRKVGPGELRSEAIQTAAMALRFLASLDAYRFVQSDQHLQERTNV